MITSLLSFRKRRKSYDSVFRLCFWYILVLVAAVLSLPVVAVGRLSSSSPPPPPPSSSLKSSDVSSSFSRMMIDNIGIGDGETFGPNRIDLDCDPCIARTDYNIRAILHGRSSDEYWIQIQRSMRQVAEDMNIQLHMDELREEGLTGEEMRDMILTAAEQAASEATTTTTFFAVPLMKTALIVSIPDETVEFAIEEVSSEIPVFSLNLPQHEERLLGLQGVVEQDNRRVGQQAAQEFLEFHRNSAVDFTSALFIQSSLQPPSVNSAKLQGFEEALSNNGITVVPLPIDPTNEIVHALEIEQAIVENCYEYQAILLDPAMFTLALDALDVCRNSYNNTPEVAIGVTNVYSEIYTRLARQDILFAFDPQIHLQASLIMVLATTFLTTATKLPNFMPLTTGPKLVTHNNVPSDSQQICQAEAFPVCSGGSSRGNSDNGDETTTQLLLDCTNCDRREIHIGGVLHGVSTDSFWDPVFEASRQAAIDTGVHLHLIRLDAANETIIFDQMAERLRELCSNNMDAVFISIPTQHDSFIQAIERCLELNVPMISVNTGNETSNRLGLVNHINQDDYDAGYEAGIRMITTTSINRAYCLNHAPGLTAIQLRCEGFAAAIADQTTNTTTVPVSYEGQIIVPLDNIAQYVLRVEQRVGDLFGDWDGIGFLSTGPHLMLALRELVEAHPRAIAGTFDVSEDIYESLADDWLIFGIDQQPMLQGYLPVYLLTYLVQTNQSLSDFHIASGPMFVTERPSDRQVVCTDNLYRVCPFHEEEFNFILEGVIIVKYCYFAINSVLCIVFAGWTIWNRREWIVKVSQPKLLVCVIVGCFISSLSILFEGIETEYRYLQDPATGEETSIVNPDIHRVDAACMAKHWLFEIGFVLSFSVLYAKIERVKKIYQASIDQKKNKKKRKKIHIRHVAHIVAILMIIFVVLLTLWQVICPYKWERIVMEVDDTGYPLDSYGKCRSTSLQESETLSQIFEHLINVVMILFLLRLLVLCWQTKDFDDAFTESSYISLAILFVFQMLLVSIPIIHLTDDPNAEFFISITQEFLASFVVLTLLFIPKMKKVHEVKDDMDDTTTEKKKIPLSSLTHSRWDEAVEILDNILREDNDTYRSMGDEERVQLRGVKTLLLEGRHSGTEDKFQYIPTDLLKTAFTRMSTGGNMKSNKLSAASSRHILREFGGVRLGSNIGKFPTMSSVEEEKDDAHLHEFMSQAIQSTEMDGDNYYIPREFHRLSDEDKLIIFGLLSWTSIGEWDYDIFELARVSGGHPLLFMGYAILGSPYSLYAMGKDCGAFKSDDVSIDDFRGYDFITDPDLQIPMRYLCNYLRTIEEDYTSENPYHNEIHGADVLQTLHALLQMKGDTLPDTKHDLFSVLLAAAVHDVNHPGENNAFQSNLETDLALVYNDTSVLENRHASHAFVKMLKGGTVTGQMSERRSLYEPFLIDTQAKKDSNKNNVLCNANRLTMHSVKKKIISAVLQTDMSKHFQSVGELKKLVLSGEIKDDEHRWKILEYMLHLADISNPAKPKRTALLWTDRCLEEFFAQGDKELKLGLPISPLCDRRTTKKPDSQIGFIKFVIKPAYDLLAEILPNVKEQIVVRHIDTNLQYWEKEKEIEEKKGIE